MAWVCISKTSQHPSVGSSTPSSLSWVKAVCLINPPEILACFSLLPFLWEQAALRRTWADLEEGKRAKFMKRATLARKKRPKCRDWVYLKGETYIVSLGCEDWDISRKGTQAPRGHDVKWVCKLKKSGTLNPKQSIKWPDVTSVQQGGLKDEGEGEKEIKLIPLGVGLAGKAAVAG